MDFDPVISYWILDFLLRKPLEGRTLNSLIRTLPPPNNKPHLKIFLLFQKLESDVSRNSISESTLKLLEHVEELLFQQGIEEVSDRMKRAYCAVAVECTVRHLENWNSGENSSKSKFILAVERVWRGMVGRMQKVVKGGLGSEELWGWKDELEAAVFKDSDCENVVKRSTRVNAVEAVRAYLREEWEMIGPSFIEVVEHRMKNFEILKTDLIMGSSDAIAGKQETPCRAGRNTDARKDSKDVQKEKSHPKSKHVGYNRSRGLPSGNSRGVKIADSDEMTTQPSHRNNKLPLSSEVNRVREALESSSLELQAVVKDPLPDVLQLAETISGMTGKSKSHDPVEVNHVEANLLVVEGAGGTGCNASNVHRPSLMERNGSARTYEWDESIVDSQEDSADRRGRPQLPTPRKLHVSPLNKYEIKSVKKRRKIKKWSPLEEDTLRTGVEKYGKGNWKVILNDNPHTFEDRTEVDLKDKWRNLTRY